VREAVELDDDQHHTVNLCRLPELLQRRPVVIVLVLSTSTSSPDQCPAPAVGERHSGALRFQALGSGFVDVRLINKQQCSSIGEALVLVHAAQQALISSGL